MQIEFSYSSWHYRFMRFMDQFYNVSGYPANDLCSYMRSFIFAVFVAVMVIAIGVNLIPAYIEGWYLTVHLHAWVHGTRVIFPNTWVAVWANIALLEWLIINVCLGVGIVIACVTGLVVLHEIYQDRKLEKQLLNRISPKQPGLLRLWYCAFKQKVCPLIVVTHKKENTL